MLVFFFHNTAPTDIYPLSLHDALPISRHPRRRHAGWARRPTTHRLREARVHRRRAAEHPHEPRALGARSADRKSTRLNSSHVEISYAVFCLKKKKKKYRDLSIAIDNAK